VILACLLKKPLVASDEQLILDRVDRELWQLGDRPWAPRRNSKRTLAWLDNEDDPDFAPDLLEHCIRILIRALPQRLLERTEQQRRRRRTINVTPEGEQLLRAHWKDCLHEHPDVESVLRSAAVALLMDDFPTADGYLISMARTSEGRAEKAAISDDRDRGRSPMQRFALMRRLSETRRHQSAAGLFREIVRELEELERS
jgi:hypothetical protein